VVAGWPRLGRPLEHRPHDQRHHIYFAPGFDLGQQQLVDFQEDVHGGMTTVVSDGTVRTMMTNGKFEGTTAANESTDPGGGDTEPVRPAPGAALNIGIGTGQNARCPPGFRLPRVDAVDISPNIVSAAQRFFGTSPGRFPGEECARLLQRR